MLPSRGRRQALGWAAGGPRKGGPENIYFSVWRSKMTAGRVASISYIFVCMESSCLSRVGEALLRVQLRVQEGHTFLRTGICLYIRFVQGELFL